MLFSYTSNISCEDVEEMLNYINRKNIFINYVISYIIYDIIIAIIIFCLSDIITAFIYFIFCLVISIIYCKRKILLLVTKSAHSFFKKNKINNIEEKIEFYKNYLVYKTINDTIKVKYNEFTYNMETDKCFYLKYIQDKKGQVIILKKSDMSLELIQFIKSNIKNIENKLDESKYIKKNKKKTIINEEDKKKKKNIIIILTILSFLCIFGAITTHEYYNEINKISIENAIKSMWIFWLWLPLPIASTIISYKYYKNGLKSFKNFICCLIVSVILIMFGVLAFVPDDMINNDINYINSEETDYSIINDYKEILDIELPLTGTAKKTSTDQYKYIGYSNVKIFWFDYSDTDTDSIIDNIKNNEKWIIGPKVGLDYKKLIPTVATFNENEYYMFYNKTLNEYNMIPSIIGEYEYLAIIYNTSTKQLVIYNLEFNNN